MKVWTGTGGIRISVKSRTTNMESTKLKKQEAPENMQGMRQGSRSRRPDTVNIPPMN
jgi:hypothetical protein